MINDFHGQNAFLDEAEASVKEIKEILNKCDLEFENKESSDVFFAVAAFLLAKANKYDDPFSITFDYLCNDQIDEDISKLAIAIHINDVWDQLVQLLKRYDEDVFIVISLRACYRYTKKIPYAVKELASHLLHFKAGEKFAELCCKTGDVVLSMKRSNPSINAIGYEMDINAIVLAKILNEYDSHKVSFYEKDIFSLVDEDSKTNKYNKIFANYPFGIGINKLDNGKEYLEKLSKKIPSIVKSTSSDWVYNMLMIDLLTKNGKAVGIMATGGTKNMNDAPIREFFVENGLIESVITLPPKIFANTPIETSIIVLSYGNKGVRLVDATSQFKADRRINYILENNIESIINMIDSDSEKSIFIDKKTLREKDYVLDASRYYVGSNNIEDGVVFGNVIKNITRGAHINAKQLDEISSSDPSESQYIMLSNIQNGIIDSNLPYLDKIDKNNEKYCLKDHCLILSKNGYPYKVAVAEIEQDKKILANGNLYIIELNEELIDPYYLAAFFSSNDGAASLRSISTGTTIKSIGVEQLKKLIIPLPPMEKQREIAIRYKGTRDEIITLQHKIEKARHRMEHLFSKE